MQHKGDPAHHLSPWSLVTLADTTAPQYVTGNISKQEERQGLGKTWARNLVRCLLIRVLHARLTVFLPALMQSTLARGQTTPPAASNRLAVVPLAVDPPQRQMAPQRRMTTPSTHSTMFGGIATSSTWTPRQVEEGEPRAFPTPVCPLPHYLACIAPVLILNVSLLCAAKRPAQDVLWRVGNSLIGVFRPNFMEVTMKSPDL